MARDHARIRLDIWNDDDWRDLTHDGQWLYMCLLSQPSLTFAGVADWRPARLAAMTRDLTATDVEIFAAELEHERFILVDRRSEEVLIRSWVKHDGLMSSPNMAVALAKDHAEIGSAAIRGVVVDQLHALHQARPDLKGWSKPQVEALLAKRSMTFAEGVAAVLPNPSGNPFGNPSLNPSGTPSGNVSRDPSGNPSPTPLLPNSLPPVLPSSSSAGLSSHQSATGARA